MWFSFGVQENSSEKRLSIEIASIQFAPQTVDFYQMSVLRTSQAGIDLLPSAMLTAERNQKFNASSAESFHRKRRAETLPTLPVLRSSVSPQITFEELTHILPCLHSQNTNLTALKGGSSATIWEQTPKNEQFLVKSSTTASWVTALLPARQDGQLTCFYNTRWKDEESNQALIPIQKSKQRRNLRLVLVVWLLCISPVAF